MKKTLLLLLISLNLFGNNHFVIVICSFNNADVFEKNLDTCFAQEYPHYRVIYVDDHSTDGTGELVKRYVESLDLNHKITLIQNNERKLALANLYTAIHECAPSEIIVNLDGDDWLAHTKVLDRLNEAYSDPNVWLTYGQLVEYHGENRPLEMGIAKEVPRHVLENGTIRQSAEGGVITQLRTFYAGLFQKIKKEDLLCDGDFFPMAYDVAMLMPMVEMAGSHCQFIPDVLYVYNRVTPINDDKVNKDLQFHLDATIRKREPYSPIREDELFTH